MRSSTKEIEIKLPFDSPAVASERLERLGVVLIQPRTFEDNRLFDRRADPLAPTDRMLRLRRAGDVALLTFKAPVEGQHRHKVREEHETLVDDPDALVRILDRLGFSSSYRYQKYRTVYELDNLHVCLDETPLGCFVELEGRPEEIDRVASRLGFEESDYVRESYRELHELAASRDGAVVGDLLVDPHEGDRQR